MKKVIFYTALCAWAMTSLVGFAIPLFAHSSRALTTVVTAVGWPIEWLFWSSPSIGTVALALLVAALWASGVALVVCAIWHLLSRSN